MLKLNQPEASDVWLTDDALCLVSKTVSDKLRAHLLSQGISGIPERNTTLFNILQEHGLVLDNPEGKAIWRATVCSDSGWTQTFTLLKLAPHLIWEPDQRPASFAGSLQVESAAATETPPPLPWQTNHHQHRRRAQQHARLTHVPNLRPTHPASSSCTGCATG